MSTLGNDCRKLFGTVRLARAISWHSTNIDHFRNHFKATRNNCYLFTQMGRSRCRSNCQGIYTLWFLKKLKRAGVPQSDFVYYYEAVIRSVMEYASPSLASHLNSQKHLKQFSNELVRSLLEAVHTAVTVLLLSWTACFRLQDVNSKPKKLFNQIVSKPEHCLHYLLPTARKQSVTDRLRPANKLPRIFAKTNRFKNSFMCYMLNSLQCEWCF